MKEEGFPLVGSASTKKKKKREKKGIPFVAKSRIARTQKKTRDLLQKCTLTSCPEPKHSIAETSASDAGKRTTFARSLRPFRHRLPPFPILPAPMRKKMPKVLPTLPPASRSSLRRPTETHRISPGADAPSARTICPARARSTSSRCRAGAYGSLDAQEVRPEGSWAHQTETLSSRTRTEGREGGLASRT